MNAKRIVMSLGTLVFATAVVAGGTGAFFSDTETSAGNVFTAGSVTLELTDITHNGNNPDDLVGFTTSQNGLSFSFSDLKPLDAGNVTFDLQNGANEAYLCAMAEETGSSENGRVDPELALGDTGPDGELGEFLSFSFNGQTGTLADASGQWASLGTVDANDTGNSSFGYCFGEYNGSVCELGTEDYNITQTDRLTANVTFYAEQVRNNPDFECSDLNEPAPVDPVDAEGPFDGWNGPGALIWQAEGRFGNNDASGDWEIGVGTNTQTANQDNTNNIWVSGAAVPFTVVYDGVNATFTVNGNSATYAVGAVTSAADLNIIAGKVSSGAGDSVALANLELDGAPVNPVALTDTDDTDAQYLVVSSEDLSGGFTLTGDVTFTWTGGTTSGSRPAFQVQVRD